MKSSTGKDETIATAGIITNLRVLKSKKGDFYAQANLEDMAGSVEMLVFPDAYRRLQDKVKLEVPVLVRGGGRIEEGANPKLKVSDIMALDDAKVPLPRSLRIRIPVESASELTVDPRHTLCGQRKERGNDYFEQERTEACQIAVRSRTARRYAASDPAAQRANQYSAQTGVSPSQRLGKNRAGASSPAALYPGLHRAHLH